MADRTVGVLDRNDAKIQRGYTLFSAGQETYLIDEDGCVVHEWRSSRKVFCAYLLPTGHLLRDGSETVEAPCFQAGGAAGFVEEVTWDNKLVWSYAMTPYHRFLSHHDLEPMPNGHVLVLCWERKSKKQALLAGRRPDLIPDDEVWNNLVLEIAPDGTGGARVAWQWSMWDHLVSDYEEEHRDGSAGFECREVAAHPELFDVNFCPPNGKNGARNRSLLGKGGPQGPPLPSGLAVFGGEGEVGKTGEKDWLHINAVSYDPVRDQIVMSINIASEVIVIDHGLTTEEARGHTGGKRGKGGDILYRFGNPQAARRGSCMDQVLFCQHSAQFLRGVPGDGHILLFNNGRAPDRQWSTVDEFELCDNDGDYAQSYQGTSRSPVWRYGHTLGRARSFYCTHISSCQRLQNGNTLVTMGPQGIIVEVTPGGEEVWRYVNPVMVMDGAVACVRQGDQRTCGRFSLFCAQKYAVDYPAFNGDGGQPLVLTPGRHLEA